MNKPTFSKSLVPFIVSLALFIEAVDTTVLNTAIPAMSYSLNVNPIDLKIALISYLLSLAIFIPISGWMADKFGIKKIFITAVAIFIVASFWCGFSHTLLQLVLARMLQGLGGALMVPVGRLIIVRTFQRNEFIVVMSRVVVIAALGMMLGPLLGGYITHYISWRWIFWVNIPIGLFTILLATYGLPTTPPQTVPPLDKLGLISFGLGLGGITFGLAALSESNFNATLALLIILIAIIFLFIYFFHSRRQTYPIVNTKLFLFRTFQISVMGNLISRISFGGLPFLLPLFLQIGLGYPAQISGLLLAPTALGVLLIKPFSSPILHFFGYKKLLTLNTIFVGLSLWSFALITQTTPPVVIATLTFLFGFLIALQYSGMNSLVYAEIPSENLSAATSIMSTIQQLSQSFGVAISALIIRFVSMQNQNVLTPVVFHYAFLTMGIITLLSIFIFTRLNPADGQQMLRIQ